MKTVLGLEILRDRLIWVQLDSHLTKLIAWGEEKADSLSQKFQNILKSAPQVHASISPATLFLHELEIPKNIKLSIKLSMAKCALGTHFYKRLESSYAYTLCLGQSQDKERWLIYFNHSDLNLHPIIKKALDEEKIVLHPFAGLVDNNKNEVLILKKEHGFDVFWMNQGMIQICQTLSENQYSMIERFSDREKDQVRILLPNDGELIQKLKTIGFKQFKVIDRLCLGLENIPEEYQFINQYFSAIASAKSNVSVSRPYSLSHRFSTMYGHLKTRIRVAALLIMALSLLILGRFAVQANTLKTSTLRMNAKLEQIASRILGQGVPLIDPLVQVKQVLHNEDLWETMSVEQILNFLESLQSRDMSQINLSRIVLNVQGGILEGSAQNKQQIEGWVSDLNQIFSLNFILERSEILDDEMEFKLKFQWSKNS